MVRSVVLFTHVIGMLVLFISIAFEWLTLESLRRATTSEQASSLVRLREMLPRVYGIAFVTLFVSGIYLARRLGLFEFAWVRLALSLLILMGILGGRAVRSRVRAVRDAVGQGGEHPWLRASLFMRAAMGLAAVYLMIGKPLLSGSLIVTGVAVAVGLTIGLLNTAASHRPSSSAR